MKTEITDEILALANESKRLRSFINDKLPKLRERCKDRKDGLDKHRDGFELDEAIQSFNIKLSYQSFSGNYGSSSVYSDFCPNNEIMGKYFLKYLNKHTSEIFNEMADMMIADAKVRQDEAIEELNSLKTKMEKIIEL